MRHLAPIAPIVTILALALHALSLPAVVALRGAVALELLAAGSLAVFLAMRFWGRDEKRVASVSIFTASLVLSLAAPALFLRPAAGRDEWWALLGGQVVETGTAALAFPLWTVSLLAGGIAMHLFVSNRWRRLSGAVSG